MMYNCVWNLIICTKFSGISQKEKGVWFFDYHLWKDGAKNGAHMFDAKYRHVFIV